METARILKACGWSGLILAAGNLSACQSDLVGGPCSYESDIIEAKVAGTEGDTVMFNGPDGDFRLPASSLEGPLETGQTVTLERQRIVSGTCTPVMYNESG